MARVKNLKGANSRLNKDAKAGWVVWGNGDTEGTSFATLAQKVGWVPCEHPYSENEDFDEETEWAIVLVCSERELEAAAGKVDVIEGWAELAQQNKDTSPGYAEDEDEDGEEDEEDSSDDTDEEDEDDDEEDEEDEEDEDEDDEDEE